MERIKLTAQSRTLTGSQVKQLRRQGIVPGVVYGACMDSKPLQFEERELARVLSTASTSLINLSVDSAAPPQLVLLREAQRNPLTRQLLHVDFMAVQMTEQVRMEIPVVLTGASKIAGVLLSGITTIEIQALPDNLISSIEIDVSRLEIGDALYVKDLDIPESVHVLTDQEELIASLTYESAQEIEEKDQEVYGEVEVIRRKEEEDF